MLDKQVFLEIVKNAPLVSIDLIVTDMAGRILLGRRNNKPAQDYWFVPGGRVFKDERLDVAFERIAKGELGISGVARRDAAFLGVYEHLYVDNFAAADGVSTHYIVLGYEINSSADFNCLPVEQHLEYRWFSKHDLLCAEFVHDNTKNYFR